MKPTSVNKIRFNGALLAFAFVFIFGVVFTGLAVKLSRQTIPENYIETEAKITRIEEELLPGNGPSDSDLSVENYEYHVFVSYSYEGKSYTDCAYGNYDSSMKEGDTVLLYLNPDDPAEFISDPSGGTVFVIIGAVIVLVGIGGIVYTIYKKKRGIA